MKLSISTVLQFIQLLANPKAIWRNFKQSPITSTVGYASVAFALLAHFHVGGVSESFVTVVLLAAVGFIGVFTKDTELKNRVREQTEEFINARRD